MKTLGTIRHTIDISNEYEFLAKNDEDAAKISENLRSYKFSGVERIGVIRYIK